MKFVSAIQPNMLLLLLSCFCQLQICASSFFFAPPQKYSLHLSRKELINELQGLSRKVGELRSKWSDEAAQQTSNLSLKDLLSAAEEQSKKIFEPANSITSLKTDVEDPVSYSKYQKLAGLVHRPTPAEISLGIFNIKNYIQTRRLENNLRKQDLKELEPLSNTQDTKEDQEVVTMPAELSTVLRETTEEDDEESRIAEIKPKPSIIRDCLFLRSGCVPVRRLDGAKTSAYLDKVQALMSA